MRSFFDSPCVSVFQITKASDINTLNQSRICGKGVGLSLFPSDSLSFESYEQFVRKSKKSKNDCFFGHFWAKIGYVSHIPAIRI